MTGEEILREAQQYVSVPGIITAACLLWCAVRGYRRGFIRELVSTVFVLLALVLVWVINPHINTFIRENTPLEEAIQNQCKKMVTQQTDSSPGMNAQDQENLLEGLSLPDLLTDGLRDNNTAETYKYLSVTSFVDYVSGYLSETIVNGVSFVVSFLLATLLIRMVTYALDVLARFPILNGINRLTGALVGLAKGVIFVWIAFLIITIFCSTRLGGQLLSLISGDPFLSVLYENDVLVKVFMSIFYGSA